MKSRIINLLIIVSIIMSILLSGCVDNKSDNKDKADKVSTIRIGSTAPGHAKFVVEEEKKWMEEEFAKDEIKVEFYPFTGGGSEAMTALASGSLDFAYTGSDPPLRTVAAGADIKLIAISQFGNPNQGSSIIVKNGSTIKSAKDLKGKKVAYLKGTVRHSTLAKALQYEGLTMKDIESLNLNFQASAPALLRGDIDAIVESATTIYPLVSKGEAVVIWDAKDHSEVVTAASQITVSGDFARKHPDIVKRFLKVDAKTAEWIDKNYEEAVRVFANGTKQDEEAVRRIYVGSFYVNPKLSNEAVDSLKEQESFMRVNNIMEGKVNFDTFLDKSFQDEISK